MAYVLNSAERLNTEVDESVHAKIMSVKDPEKVTQFNLLTFHTLLPKKCLLLARL